MNVFGLKVESKNGVSVIDPDSYTVRLIESKLLDGNTYWVSGKSWYDFEMSPAVKAGMFVVFSPLDTYQLNRNMATDNFGAGTKGRPAIERGLPQGIVGNGKISVNFGDVQGLIINSDMLIAYVIEYN